MNVSVTAFREPRGVMRILQFIFAIVAFSTISGYSGESKLIGCCSNSQTIPITFSYPFRLDATEPIELKCNVSPATGTTDKPPALFYMEGNFSSDAQFFVATGVLAFLFSMGIVVVYALMEEKYQSNSMLPLVDFLLTTVLAVLWLSSSAAWANSLTGIKTVTEPTFLTAHTNNICKSAWTGSYSSLNISVLLGFLNFFLWASDLWFLYKETHWFKMRQESAGSGGV